MKSHVFILFEPCYLQKNNRTPVGWHSKKRSYSQQNPSSMSDISVVDFFVEWWHASFFQLLTTHNTWNTRKIQACESHKTPPASRKKTHPQKEQRTWYLQWKPHEILPSPPPPRCLPRFLLICFQLWFRWSVFPQLGKETPTATGVDRLAETLRSAGMLWEGFNL